MQFDFSNLSKAVSSVSRVSNAAEVGKDSGLCAIPATGHDENATVSSVASLSGAGHNGTQARVQANDQVTDCNYKGDSLAGHSGHNGHAISASDWQERYEAQAATREYEGGLPREEAEWLARREIFFEFAGAYYPRLLATFEAMICQPVIH